MCMFPCAMNGPMGGAHKQQQAFTAMLEVSFAAVTSAAHDQVRLSPHNTRSAVAEAGRNDCCKSHDYACYKFDIGAGDPKGICMPENPQPVSAGVAVPGGGAWWC